MSAWMELLAKKYIATTYKEWLLLADKVHKQEPQCKWLHNVCAEFLKEQKQKIFQKTSYCKDF